MGRAWAESCGKSADACIHPAQSRSTRTRWASLRPSWIRPPANPYKGWLLVGCQSLGLRFIWRTESGSPPIVWMLANLRQASLLPLSKSGLPQKP